MKHWPKQKKDKRTQFTSKKTPNMFWGIIRPIPGEASTSNVAVWLALIPEAEHQHEIDTKTRAHSVPRRPILAAANSKKRTIKPNERLGIKWSMKEYITFYIWKKENLKDYRNSDQGIRKELEVVESRCDTEGRRREGARD